jgi:hypothetical protein
MFQIEVHEQRPCIMSQQLSPELVFLALFLLEGDGCAELTLLTFKINDFNYSSFIMISLYRHLHRLR